MSSTVKDIAWEGSRFYPSPLPCCSPSAPTAAKPPHSFLRSCSVSAPGLYQDTAEELYWWDALPSASRSHGKKSYSSENLTYSCNVIGFHKRFPAAPSAAWRLSSFHHTSPLRSGLYRSFHSLIQPPPASSPVSGFNARALCCSKRGRERLCFFCRAKSAESAVGKLETRRAEMGRDRLVVLVLGFGFFLCSGTQGGCIRQGLTFPLQNVH